jgi:hypothetical protein
MRTALIASGLLLSLVAGCASHAQRAPQAPATAAQIAAVPPAEVRAIAQEAFVYGFPMVINYGTIFESFIDTKSSQYRCPINQLFNMSRVFTPADTAVVTPNSDTPYSFFCADLRSEPVVVTVPAIEKSRYFSVQLVDWYTFNFGYIGSRTTGNGGGSYLIAGPGWNGTKPAGIAAVYRCETEFVFGIFRTQLFDAADIGKVRQVQAGYSVRPLSSFLKDPAGKGGVAPAPEIAWIPLTKERAETDPFAYLNFVLQFCPPTGPAAAEQAMRARFARIGIGAGLPSPMTVLTPEQRAALVEGMKAGMAAIATRAEALGRDENGWRVGAAFGDRAFYKGDWLLRAAAAKAGIYGNYAQEALYPMLARDSEGNKPDCSANRYTLTFAKGQLPPANAFWSVTMYDGKTQLLVANPINRYLVNSPMLPSLKTAADGSLTLYIQKDSPGKDKESNWLPAPAGPVYIVMRLYWPKDQAISGQWKPPALVRVK